MDFFVTGQMLGHDMSPCQIAFEVRWPSKG
jgi:hypothetical protein